MYSGDMLEAKHAKWNSGGWLWRWVCLGDVQGAAVVPGWSKVGWELQFDHSCGTHQ